MRFHHTTQNGTQFKTYELFISGIFHLIFSDCSWPWVTKTPEMETSDKEELPYIISASLISLNISVRAQELTHQTKTIFLIRRQGKRKRPEKQKVFNVICLSPITLTMYALHKCPLLLSNCQYPIQSPKLRAKDSSSLKYSMMPS